MFKQIWENVVSDPLKDFAKYASIGLAVLAVVDIGWSAAESISLTDGVLDPHFSKDVLSHTFDRHPLFGAVHDAMESPTVQVLAGGAAVGIVTAPWLAPWLWPSAGGGHHVHKEEHGAAEHH